MKRYFLLVICLFSKIILYAQSHYDYMDDNVVARNAGKASDGVIIFFAITAITIGLIFIISLLIKIYYQLNPKASPDYQRAKAKQEKEKNQEAYVQEQRTKAIPSAVDLGLSVKWAEFNIGAYKPSDIGSCFYWAENKPSVIGEYIYPHINAQTFGDIAGIEKFDAATHIYGKNWRLPSEEECKELLSKCVWEVKNIDGIEGRLVTGLNGNSIFLPYTDKKAIKNNHTSGCHWNIHASQQIKV